MKKIKISKPQAYSRFNEEDFENMNYRTQKLFDHGKQLGKKTTAQFFYEEEKDLIILEVYWNEELISEFIYF